MARPDMIRNYKVLTNLDADESADVGVAQPCNLYGWFIHNAASATRYIRLYNLATAATVGTTATKLLIPIPAGASANVEFVGGIKFDAGISIGATTGVAANDTGAPGANECIVTLFYL